MSLYEELEHKIELDFTPEELTARYKAERDKRVRTDYEDQFVRVGPDSHAELFAQDPYTPVAPRAEVDDDVECLIIGGGWVGLLAAARLKEAGHTDIRILDGAGDFGGVWYWNRYPGAQCDVQSYVYLPLLEETNYVPRERYSHAAEIYEHAQRIGRHYKLYEDALFHTWVTDLRWDERAHQWIVKTNRDDDFRARHVVMGTGSASRLRLPGIPGLDDFKGVSFHTSRWNYDYTGGDNSGNLDKLADKRVAIIGTGASGVQVIPRVAAAAKQTYVFQRTPSTVNPRGNAPTDADWASTLGPGWQQALIREFDDVAGGRAVPESPTIKSEPMFKMLENIGLVMANLDPSTMTPEEIEEAVALGDHLTMSQVRGRIDEIVTNPEHAELLKPWYRFLCKRPTCNDEFYPAFNRPNVTLVDVSASQGVERITESGVVANGVEHVVDCIVFASGFEITSSLERRIGIPIFGEGGQSLYDHWRDGYRTLHGIMTHGFPNMFFLGGLFAQTLSPNYTTPLENQAKHVAANLSALKDRGVTRAAPTAEAEAEWVAHQLEDGSNAMAVNFGGRPDTCTPGYYTHEGKPLAERRNVRMEGYTQGAATYWQVLQEWRDEGQLRGLEISTTELEKAHG